MDKVPWIHPNQNKFATQLTLADKLASESHAQSTLRRKELVLVMIANDSLLVGHGPDAKLYVTPFL